MNQKFLLTLFAACLFLQGFAQSISKEDHKLFTGKQTSREQGPFLYTLTTFNEPYTDLSEATSLNNGEIWDDLDYDIPLDFVFELNGNIIVYLQFVGTGANLRSTTGGSVDTYVIPFEMDLMDRGSGTGASLSPISYKTEGESGSRIMKIEMKNVGSKNEYIQSGTTDMYINLQLWLYENYDVVEFRFGENSITDPATFYPDDGAIVGIVDYKSSDSIFINPHFLEGPASNPELGISGIPLLGTPSEGTVYRFAPIPPVSVFVMGNNSTSFCNPNGSATAFVSGGLAPYTFLWNTGDTTATITGLNDDIYVVTVTDQQGATKTGVVFITNVNPIHPNVSTTLETDIDANDGTATSSAVGGAPPYSFAWSNGDSSQIIAGLPPATYTVTVTDSEGCTGTESVIVNHFGCFEINVDVYSTSASCAGVCDASIEVLAHGGTLPFTFTLSDGGGGPGMCAGTYYLTVTDADGCGVISDPILIIAYDGVTSITGSTKETAPFANDGTAWVEPIEGTPPFYYAWSNGSLESLITGLEPGSYTVTVTDANGCADTTTVIVDAFGCSAYTESFITRNFCLDSCSWSIITLLVPGVGPLDYAWSTGDTTISIENLCPGTYSLTIVDEGYGDCTYVEDFIIFPNDYVEGVVDEVIHVTDTTAGAISITAIAGQNIYEYRWSGPNWYISWDEDISGLLPGFYSVEIKSHWGCARIDSIEVKDLTVSTGYVANLDARIYPNPASDQINIEIENISAFRIQLMSLDGREIKTWDGERVLDVGEVPAGIYLLEGVSGDGVFRKQISIIR